MGKNELQHMESGGAQFFTGIMKGQLEKDSIKIVCDAIWKRTLQCEWKNQANQMHTVLQKTQILVWSLFNLKMKAPLKLFLKQKIKNVKNFILGGVFHLVSPWLHLEHLKQSHICRKHGIKQCSDYVGCVWISIEIVEQRRTLSLSYPQLSIFLLFE